MRASAASWLASPAASQARAPPLPRQRPPSPRQRGGLACCCAQPKRPVALTVTTSGASPSRRRRLHASVVSPEVYWATFRRKVELLCLIGSPARRLDALITAAHAAAKVADADHTAGPRLLAEVALHGATHARRGRRHEARAMCDAIPPLARYASAEEGLPNPYAKCMETELLADLAALER